ncbi:MAG: acetolactate synthase small subunit [Myxococcota bacterium]|jgi:acetolactate synthase-1/3 small subunit|nr:acetolactate synthase small subunit [Deltaproteobacteria bacterium]MCP4240465.1 acetolactate synthase small subunit [bacterium]MDP6076438.1 acetolactate synthase small subunit [Myxococcota bacterium]MDP6242985.1 acetolactate synthase small subunit [Myxococcota bacterium]MDP7073326.1 acetolactate synthase small subunit [Myxococcota bacterium]
MSAAEPIRGQEAPPKNLHTISLFVTNQPGVLVRVALVFSRRGFNIESLVVSPAAEGRFSRMTIACSGAPEVLEQVVKQLAKLVDVVHAIDHTGDESYEVEIALVKLETALDRRTEILQIAEHYKARVVDYGPDSLILQAFGSSEKLDAFIELLRPFHLTELVRSGKLLMARSVAVT